MTDMGLDTFPALFGPHMFHPNEGYIVVLDLSEIGIHQLTKLSSYYLLAMDYFTPSQCALCWDLEVHYRQLAQGELDAFHFVQFLQVLGYDRCNFLKILRDRLLVIVHRIFRVQEDDPNYL